VTQLALRPGRMTMTLPLAPVMVFVHGEQPTLVATFPQNATADLKPGLEAEVRSRPILVGYSRPPSAVCCPRRPKVSSQQEANCARRI
jgi:hypothetical protein